MYRNYPVTGTSALFALKPGETNKAPPRLKQETRERKHNSAAHPMLVDPACDSSCSKVLVHTMALLSCLSAVAISRMQTHVLLTNNELIVECCIAPLTALKPVDCAYFPYVWCLWWWFSPYDGCTKAR